MMKTHSHGCYSFALSDIKGTLKPDARGMKRLKSSVSQVDAATFAKILDSLFCEGLAAFCCDKQKGFVLLRTRKLKCVIKEYNLTNAQLVEVCDMFCDSHPGCCSASTEFPDDSTTKQCSKLYYALPDLNVDPSPQPSTSTDPIKTRAGASAERSRKKRRPSPDTDSAQPCTVHPSTSAAPQFDHSDEVDLMMKHFPTHHSHFHQPQQLQQPQYYQEPQQLQQYQQFQQPQLPVQPPLQMHQPFPLTMPPQGTSRRPSMDAVVNASNKAAQKSNTSNDGGVYGTGGGDAANSHSNLSLDFKKLADSVVEETPTAGSSQSQLPPNQAYAQALARSQQPLPQLRLPRNRKEASVKDSIHVMAIENDRKAKKRPVAGEDDGGGGVYASSQPLVPLQTQVLPQAQEQLQPQLNPQTLSQLQFQDIMQRQNAFCSPDSIAAYNAFDLDCYLQAIIYRASSDCSLYDLYDYAEFIRRQSTDSYFENTHSQLLSHHSAQLSTKEQDKVFQDAWELYVNADAVS